MNKKVKKNLKRVSVWIAISLLVQFVGFFYVDKFFLAESKVEVKKIEPKKEKVKNEIKIKLPEGVKDVKSSYDGKYVSYTENGMLKVIEMNTGKTHNIEFEQGVTLSYYGWLSDRDRILLGEKHSNGEGGVSFKLSFYDIAKDKKDEVKELAWGYEQSEIEDIQSSTLTNVIYVKVSHGGQKRNIYWLNIMNEMKSIQTYSNLVGDMKVIPHEDKLVYEDKATGNIYVTNVGGTFNNEEMKNPTLLGIDRNDVIYAGDLEDDKVKTIYYGTWKDKELQKIDLANPVSKENIIISLNGDIYVNDNLKGEIVDLKTGKITIYEGVFLKPYNRGIITLGKDNYIKQVNFAK